MKRPLIALAAVVICALPLVALADWDPCCPCPDTKFVQLPDPTGWDVNCTSPKILADDFICTETGWITDVHLWGSWQEDWVGEFSRIHLSFHSDVPASPDLYSYPGQELWAVDIFPDQVPDGTVVVQQVQTCDQGWYDPNTGDYWRHDHQQMWQVNIFLDNWLPYEELFVQRGTEENPVVYWLDVQVDVLPVAGTDITPLFGWKTSYEHKGPDDAVWGDLLRPGFSVIDPTVIEWYELRDPIYPEESLDLAFVLTGIPIPEPGILAVAGFGLLVLLRRKK